MAGAIDWDECKTRSSGGGCRCAGCSVCGKAKHTAIHAPFIRGIAGSKPYGHEFKAKKGNIYSKQQACKSPS